MEPNKKSDLFMSNDDKSPWGAANGSSKKESGDEKNSRSPWEGGPFKDPKQNEKLEETLQKMQQRFRDSFGGGGGTGSGPRNPFTRGPSKGAIIAGVVILAVLWLSSGFFKVTENQVGVVMRFGKMNRVVTAGLQYHIPYPIESDIIRDTTVNTIEVSSGPGGSQSKFHQSQNNLDLEQNVEQSGEPTLILTGDKNMVNCNYRVRWWIKDIEAFLFNAKAPETTIRAAAESVTREVVGQSLSRDVLSKEREKISLQAQDSLQKLMDQYKLGVAVEYSLMAALPPVEVADSFNDIVASTIDAKQDINKAESYRNDILPRARGAAIQVIQESLAYSKQKIAEAEGEASRFKQVYDAYEKNKSIAVKRYYLDAMKEILSKANIMIFDPKVSQGVLPYIPLTELQKMPKNTEGAPTK